VRSAGERSARLRRRAVWRRCRPVDPRLEPLGPLHAAPHFGFNHEWRTDLPGAALARRAGADTGRMPVYWMQVERSPGRFDWRSYDIAYRALLAQGQRPIMIVMYAPCWARPSTPCPGAFGGYPPDAAYEPAWARFVRLVATRYPAARAVEVWNEPNFATFFHSPAPERYARLLREAFGAVKGVAPGLPVIGGSLAPARGWQRFLARAFAAGAGEHMEGLGLHPYPHGDRIVTDFRRQLRDARRVLARHGDERLPLWITEIGVSANPRAWSPRARGERAQARDLVELYRTALRVRGVDAFIVHGLRDEPSAGPWEAGVGVLRPDGSAKPAFCALAAQRRVPAC
jgi:hypothetical protein